MDDKISLVISSLRGGGAEGVCVTLANGLAQKGHDVELVILNLQGAVRQAELFDWVKLVDLDVAHARSSYSKLLNYLKSNKPTTVLSFNRQISVVLAIVRLLNALKFKLISRNITFLSIAEKEKPGLWHGFLSKHLIKIFYPMSDLIVAQSRAMQHDLTQYLGINESKIRVINNPINHNIEAFISGNLDFSSVNKHNYLLCVGSLEKQKAFHYAIDAFSRIAPEFPSLRLKIVGKGRLEQSLKDQAKALGVADRVNFEGFQRDMIPYYLHARATVLTSLFEGFPNVLIESIALGTPVVAFDCPSGPGEIVQDGVNGYLVRHKDTLHLEDCIQLALKRNWLASEVQKTAMRFSSDAIIEEYLSVLSQ